MICVSRSRREPYLPHRTWREAEQRTIDRSAGNFWRLHPWTGAGCCDRLDLLHTLRKARSVSCRNSSARKEGNTMKILVIGGTGNVGARSRDRNCRSAKGQTFACLYVKKTAPTPKGITMEAAIGDLLDPVSVQKALQGVDKLYLLNAVIPDELTRGPHRLRSGQAAEAETYRLSLGLPRGPLQGCSTLCLEARD